MNQDISSLRDKCYDLRCENLELRSEIAFLKGKLEAYEWFLKKKGFIEGDTHAS